MHPHPSTPHPPPIFSPDGVDVEREGRFIAKNFRVGTFLENGYRDDKENKLLGYNPCYEWGEQRCRMEDGLVKCNGDTIPAIEDRSGGTTTGVEWKGSMAYFKASEMYGLVSNSADYKFTGCDYGEGERIDQGHIGQDVACGEDGNWVEYDTELEQDVMRTIRFGSENFNDGYYTLTKAWMRGKWEDVMDYSLSDDMQSVIRIPRNPLDGIAEDEEYDGFFCESVELTLEGFSTSGSIIAKDFTIAFRLPEDDYNPDTLRLFNPCRSNGECKIVNEVLECNGSELREEDVYGERRLQEIHHLRRPVSLMDRQYNSAGENLVL